MANTTRIINMHKSISKQPRANAGGCFFHIELDKSLNFVIRQEGMSFDSPKRGETQTYGLRPALELSHEKTENHISPIWIGRLF